jgi:putative transposase
MARMPGLVVPGYPHHVTQRESPSANFERNPVAARLCQHPGDWPWSSARAHLEGVDDLLVTVKQMFDRVPDWEAYLCGTTLYDETESIRQHNRTGRPLGTAEFIQTLELQTGRTLTPKRPGPKPPSIN